MAEEKKNRGSSRCSGSVTGHSAGKDGMCLWGCGTRLREALPKPRTTEETELGQAYRRHYDPDYGTGKYDT